MFKDYKNLNKNLLFRTLDNDRGESKYLFQILPVEKILEIIREVDLRCHHCDQFLPKLYFEKQISGIVVEAIRLNTKEVSVQDSIEIFDSRYVIFNNSLTSEFSQIEGDYFLVLASHTGSLEFKNLKSDLNIHESIFIFLFKEKSEKADSMFEVSKTLKCICDRKINDYLNDNLIALSNITFNNYSLNFLLENLSSSELKAIKINELNSFGIEGISLENSQFELKLQEEVFNFEPINYLFGDITPAFLKSIDINIPENEDSLAKVLGIESQLSKAFASTIGARLNGIKAKDLVNLNSILYCPDCKGAGCEDCRGSGYSDLADSFEILGSSFKQFVEKPVEENLAVLEALGSKFDSSLIELGLGKLPSDFFNSNNKICNAWITLYKQKAELLGLSITENINLTFLSDFSKLNKIILLGSESTNPFTDNCLYVKRDIDLKYRLYRYE